MFRSIWCRAGLLLIVFCVLAVPVQAGAGTPGPFVGSVAEGETDRHAYDNNPSRQPCIEVMAHYEVVLSYAPAGDTLVLKVDGRERAGHGGTAHLTVTAGWCTELSISVEGRAVEALAGYSVAVTRTLPGAGGPVAS